MPLRQAKLKRQTLRCCHRCSAAGLEVTLSRCIGREVHLQTSQLGTLSCAQVHLLVTLMQMLLVAAGMTPFQLGRARVPMSLG